MITIQIIYKMKHIKQIVFAVVFMVSLSSYGQFNDKGYKDLKLGMSFEEAEKITPIDLAEDESAIVIYNDLKLELTFYFNGNDNVLYTIKSSYIDAKLDGVSQEVMGKSLSEVKSILGDKLVPFEDAGPGSPYYIYYKDSVAKTNYDTSCILEFNDSGVLISIMAGFNP